jgi:hypothetical protein
MKDQEDSLDCIGLRAQTGTGIEKGQEGRQGYKGIRGQTGL